MKTVIVGYSKIRSALALFVLTQAAIAPVLFYVFLPQVYSVAGKSTLGLFVSCALIAAASIIGLVGIALILKKYKDSREAVLLYQDGIWSNVSDVSEKFVPWERVERAYVASRSESFPVIKVNIAETKEQRAQRSSISRFLKPKLTMIIWPMTLARTPFSLSDVINEYASKHEPGYMVGEPQQINTPHEEATQQAA